MPIDFSVSGLLANEVTPENEPRTSNINSQSELIYRIFDGKVAKNYFCDAIPPISPKVIEEVSATNGVVTVTTVVSETDANIFEHTITLSGLTLMNSKGERITDLTTINFGTVTTTALDVDGVNYFTDDSETGEGSTTGGEGRRIRNRVVVTNPDQDIKLTVE